MFDDAVLFTMKYEVGPWFQLDAETQAGLIATQAQRKKVGYVNDPADRGGETKFGVAQTAHPELKISTLTWEQAKKVYQDGYWFPGKCDQLSGNLAFAHFDACVNHGVRKACQFVQRAVAVKDDGVIGDGTLKAIGVASCTQNIVKLVVQQRRKFFFDIVKNDPSQKRFLDGWMARCDSIEKALQC